MCTVVNKKKEKYDVYIGRGSKWGNIFVIGKDGNRKAVIEKYQIYFNSLLENGCITDTDLLELSGQRLGCYCKPLACHGDIIANSVNQLKMNSWLM